MEGIRLNLDKCGDTFKYKIYSKKSHDSVHKSQEYE